MKIVNKMKRLMITTKCIVASLLVMMLLLPLSGAASIISGDSLLPRLTKTFDQCQKQDWLPPAKFKVPVCGQVTKGYNPPIHVGDTIQLQGSEPRTFTIKSMSIAGANYILGIDSMETSQCDGKEGKYIFNQCYLVCPQGKRWVHPKETPDAFVCSS